MPFNNPTWAVGQSVVWTANTGLSIVGARSGNQPAYAIHHTTGTRIKILVQAIPTLPMAQAFLGKANLLLAAGLL